MNNIDYNSDNLKDNIECQEEIRKLKKIFSKGIECITITYFHDIPWTYFESTDCALKQLQKKGLVNVMEYKIPPLYEFPGETHYTVCYKENIKD